jgi:hypothetical protein
LVNAQSHMHSRGSGYVASFTPKDGVDEKIYEHTSYENVPVATWGTAGKQVKAGDSIEFGCKYTNKEARTVLQGPKSTDEMCMFLALYYPKSVAIDDCAPSDDYQGPPGLAAIHRGDGTADGAATMQCMGGAAQAGPIADQTGVFTDAFTTCLLESCPNIGAPMTTAANCMFTEAFGKCTDTCTANGAECGACIQKECQASFAELSTAKCN